jgi:hypothetical protein
MPKPIFSLLLIATSFLGAAALGCKSKPPMQFAGTGPQVATTIPSFENFYVSQEENLCWAACATMVSNFSGHRTTQEEIAASIKGPAANDKGRRSANEEQVLAAMDPQLYRRLKQLDGLREQYSLPPVDADHPRTREWVRLFYILFSGPKAPEYSCTPEQLYTYLKNNQPAVLGLRGRSKNEGKHAVVVFGGTFQQGVEWEEGSDDRRPAMRVVSLTCLDPGAGDDIANRIVPYTAEQLRSRQDFVVTIDGAREYLNYLDQRSQFFHDVKSGKYDNEIFGEGGFDPNAQPGSDDDDEDN